jgi:hypothetical protein
MFASPPVTLVLVPDHSMPKGCWVHEQHAPSKLVVCTSNSGMGHWAGLEHACWQALCVLHSGMAAGLHTLHFQHRHHRALPDIKFNSCFAMARQQSNPPSSLHTSPLTTPSPQGPDRHHSTAALPCPGSKATLPPSCTLPHLHRVSTRPCQTSNSTAALPWLCTECNPPCFLHTSHCHTVITGEALPGIMQRLLCRGHAPKKPSLLLAHLQTFKHCHHRSGPGTL